MFNRDPDDYYPPDWGIVNADHLWRGNARVSTQTAGNLFDQGNYEKALECYQLAETYLASISLKVDEDNRPRSLISHDSGKCCSYIEDLAELSYYQKAVLYSARIESPCDNDHILTANIYHDIAQFHFEKQQFFEASHNFCAAFGARNKLSSKNDRDKYLLAFYRKKQADCYKRQAKYEMAHAYYNRACSLCVGLDAKPLNLSLLNQCQEGANLTYSRNTSIAVNALVARSSKRSAEGPDSENKRVLTFSGDSETFDSTTDVSAKKVM